MPTELQVQDETLRNVLELIQSMRELSKSAFELLGRLSDSTVAAAATLPSPKEIDNEPDEIEPKEDNATNDEDEMVVDKESAEIKDIAKDPEILMTESEFADTCKRLLAHLFSLREYNRQYQVSSGKSKEVVAGRRGEVDKWQLELQNVFYRQRYLRKEIESCRDIKSSHVQIDFVSLEEFYQDHPELQPDESSAMQTDTPDLDEDAKQHNLMLARLQDEYERRKKLDGERAELTQTRASLIAENKKRKADLESLDAQLQRFIESATPIQSVFDKY